MRQLNPGIDAVARQFGAANGNFVESLARVLPILSVILTAIITIGTVITGLDEPDDPGNGDSGDGGNDNPPIVSPIAPVENAQMRTDLLSAINYYRPLQGEAPASFDLELYASAQTKAVENATAGSLDQMSAAEERIILLQASQDTAVANAEDFIDLWTEDPRNYEALMHPDNHSIGIGVAEAGGKTYAVVQFTQR